MSMICLFMMCDLNVQPNNLPSSAQEATYNTSVQSRIVISYTKTIIEYYTDFSSIPTSFQYKEYSDSYQTYASGTMKLKSVTSVGSSYRCVYEGTLFGNI